MAGQKPGFTLIELLVVIAIVGILAALLIPLAMDSIQKSKQKGTMKDINSIAAAITDYITDNGTAPGPAARTIMGNAALYTALSGFYLKVLPLSDQWGTPFNVWTGSAATGSYTGITSCETDDFVVASYGRNKTADDIAFNPLAPTTAFFEITDLGSFNLDLVNWDGSWIHAPKVAQFGATT
jgi:type II secretion system protein G